MAMRRAHLALIALGIVGAAGLAGCGKFQKPQRAAWRDQAEAACMASRQVQISSYVSLRGKPIDGPGTCGMQQPLKVSAFSNGGIGLTSSATLSCPVVATTDTLVEGPDFRSAWSSGYDLGWKAAAVNLADVAAMGARPTALLVALAVPKDRRLSFVAALADGLRDACATRRQPGGHSLLELAVMEQHPGLQRSGVLRARLGIAQVQPGPLLLHTDGVPGVVAGVGEGGPVGHGVSPWCCCGLGGW